MSKIYIYAAASLAAFAALTFTYRAIYNSGYDAAINKVERQNEKAKEAASEVRRTVDSCHANGGLWDVVTGKCRD